LSQTVHLLVVRAGGLTWGLPMDSVEQTFDLRAHRIHRVGRTSVVVFRGKTIDVYDLAAELGIESGEPHAAVIVWAGGRRRVFAVDGLVGQMQLERHELPQLARGRYTTSAVLLGDDVVPVLEPGAVVGAWEIGGRGSSGFSEMQESALIEVANIGSGHAATALSTLLGRPVEVHYAEALVSTLAEAADRIGSAASQSALVDTPIADDGGKVLLIFPDGAGEDLCRLLGTTIDDELGLSALREVGNILASSYLNALVEMTGLDLEPDPPTIEVDVLGSLIEHSIDASSRPDDPAVLMRSCMTVESSDARFVFLFVPQLGSVDRLLDALGVGDPVAS
jgi:chemotaxis protein CheC